MPQNSHSEIYGTYAYDNKIIKLKDRSNRKHESVKKKLNKITKKEMLEKQKIARPTKTLGIVIIELVY